MKKKNLKESKFEYTYVPTIVELNEKLFDYHCNNFHCNEKDLIQIFKNNNMNFYGLQTIIQEYVKSCPVCVQNMKTVHRKEPVKPINVDGPNKRYEFDITNLNDDLQEAYGIKYLLCIIDVFSRKGMIYGLQNKHADNILQNIIEFCLNNGFPEEFLSDNGPELKNNKTNEFCIKNNIRYIHGIPYNPHSQGTIERFHYTIKKYLAKEYISNNYKRLNFNETRIKVINYYNNKIHRMLGVSPNTASKITNIEEINKINAIKTKEFSKINNKRNYIKEGSFGLLNPKFIQIGKETLMPNYVKKGKFNKKIPIKIIKRVSYGYYKISFSINYSYKKLKFKKGDTFVADSKLIKIINVITWKSILKAYKI